MTLFDVDPDSTPVFVRATVTDIRTVVVDLTLHPGDDVDVEAKQAALAALADGESVLAARTTSVVLVEPGLPIF